VWPPPRRRRQLSDPRQPAEEVFEKEAHSGGKREREAKGTHGGV
jgi:hypothetical protein